MSENPYIQFYPSDWLAGTRGLTAAEAGVYITLVCMMYEREEPLSIDEGRLARLCGTTTKGFKACLSALISEGNIIETDAGLWNSRCEKEIQARDEKRKSNSRAAKIRWKKTEQKQQIEDADAFETQCKTDAIPEPEPEPEEKDKSFSISCLISEEFEEWWKTQYPERQGVHSKAKAKDKYIRFRKSGVTKDQIWKATDDYFRELQETDRVGTEFVKHATTFLNDQLWEND